jgi:hypothetical protein
MARIGRGDILVVVRIDRLARALSHLLEVIERLESLGAHFKSLRDPIDTSTPQGKFALQVLGAAAELERALIRERTRAGLRAAKARGRVGGHPALRRRDPKAIATLSGIRDRQYLADLLSTMDVWLPRVRDLRGRGNSWVRVAKSLGPDRVASSNMDGGPPVAGGASLGRRGVGGPRGDRRRAPAAGEG